MAEHVLAMMLRTSPEGAAAALRGRAGYPDLLARTSVPTLVVIDGAAHMPNLERRLNSTEHCTANSGVGRSQR